jgi:UDP-N-acetylglucosamine--N-acetylmuramyl-(pentapeptide) pyrophosphoryl-undecaprenol N-acetylglucosamine transferase
MTREEGARALGFDPALRTLVIIGGSLGSRKINEAVAGALRIMNGGGRLREVQILHATGRQKSETLSADEIRLVAPRYKLLPYLDAEYPAALAAADLVVARAGASTVAEISARGLPAILIPWARATTGEQSLNAEPFGKVGAAVIIRDADLTPAALAKALEDLLWDDQKRARMARASKLLGKPRAAEAVAKIALELAEGSSDQDGRG